MTPAEFKSARRALGFSQKVLARALLMGANGDRTIRRWERGDMPISGPAQVAVGLMVRHQTPRGSRKPTPPTPPARMKGG